MVEDLNFKLLFNVPIEYEIGTFYQPTIRDIIVYGYKKFNYLLVPYEADIEMLDLNDEQKMFFKNFDLCFLRDHDGRYLFRKKLDDEEVAVVDLLCKSLKFYLKTDNIKIAQYYMESDLFPCILIDDDIMLTRDNFDEVVSLIYKINCTEKPKINKPPKFENERQRDIYQKLMSGRSRNSDNISMNLESIINSVIHGGKSYVSYKEILDMTVFQLINSYESIMKIEFYESQQKQWLAGVKPESLDLIHWTQKLKIK